MGTLAQLRTSPKQNTTELKTEVTINRKYEDSPHSAGGPCIPGVHGVSIRDRAAKAAVPPELRHPGPGGRPGVQTGPGDQGQAVEPRRGHPWAGGRVHCLQVCLHLVTV